MPAMSLLGRTGGRVITPRGRVQRLGGKLGRLLARTVTEPAVDVTYVFYAREEVAAADSGLLEVMNARPDLQSLTRQSIQHSSLSNRIPHSPLRRALRITQSALRHR